MAHIYISLGSNVEKERYVNLGLDALEKAFGYIDVSSLYACEAVGFDGPEFYNLVVHAQTDLSIDALAEQLRAIEFAHGRSPTAIKYSPRTLDLDLLLYDDVIMDSPVQLPRTDILANAFVLWPLSELAPELCHPVNQQSYQSLWQSFDKAAQQIEQVPLTWRTNYLDKQQ